MPQLNWPLPRNPPKELEDHLIGLIVVKWVFDIAPEKVEDFHEWLKAHEAELVAALSAVGVGVGYAGTYGVVDPAAGYDAVRRYRTYWTFDSEAALKAWDPDSSQSDELHIRLVNEFAMFWMSDSGSWDEVYIPAAYGSAYKFAGEYKYLPRGKLM